MKNGFLGFMVLSLVSASIFGQGPETSPKKDPDSVRKILDEMRRLAGVEPLPTPGSRSSKPLLPREIVDRAMPSVVLIVAQDEEGNAIGQGSGFFFKRGLVATNLHVFKRATQGYVKSVTTGQVKKVLEVVAIDVRRDLCVVRVNDVNTPPLNLRTLGKVAIGDDVFVISNPKGLEGTVSKGIVSSIRSDLGLIQIDSAISSGSSGGAVVDDRGEVIGIAVSSLIEGQNLNFAIPSHFLMSLEEKYRVPVFVAGAFALNDRSKEQFKGLVREVIEMQGAYDLDSRTGEYLEKPRAISDRKVFDVHGNKIEDWEYISGKFLWKYLDSYDENGFLKRRIVVYPDGQQKTYEFTLQESMSRRLNEKKFSDVDETAISKSVYDRNGNEVERSLRLADGSTRRWTSIYDKNGFMVEQKVYKENTLENTSRYLYVTDENGNWTRRHETSFSYKRPQLGYTPSMTTYREISYF